MKNTTKIAYSLSLINKLKPLEKMPCQNVPT